METTNTHPKPIDVPPEDTIGQDTERNYRYQHSYGAILLIGAACNKLPYISIYVEHHEDILCERSDGLFDGYQIKTRTPEDGKWELNDDAVKKSIRHFVELNKVFSEYIRTLKFVSNVDFSNPGNNIQDQLRLRRSPVRFLEMLMKCSGLDEISPPYIEMFLELQEYCNCSPEELFSTLQKVEFFQGPDRNSFDSEIITTHLATMSECSSYPVSVLETIRDEIIHNIWLAASDRINDPSKHWSPKNKMGPDNPYINAKRLSVEFVMQTIRDKTEPSFRYFDIPTLAIGNGKGNLEIIKKKMKRGNLNDQILTMERRSLSAEQNLMELAFKDSNGIEAHLAQLESIVQGECDEAHLHASLNGEPFGRQMLDDVYTRLKRKAEEHDLVLRQPYELLAGIAGLLTGECKVWWSERFDLDGEE